MRKTVTLQLSLIFSLLVSPALASDSPVMVTNVLTTEKAWNGSALPGYTTGSPQLRVNHFTIKPGVKTSVHLHPANGAGYIISGELTMYSTSDTNGNFSDPAKVKSIVLKTGEAWAESVNSWHYGVNNGDKDVIFVVAFASEDGVPSTMSMVSPGDN